MRGAPVLVGYDVVLSRDWCKPLSKHKYAKPVAHGRPKKEAQRAARRAEGRGSPSVGEESNLSPRSTGPG